MSTTRDEIRLWLHDARKAGATHVIVVCDTFDYNDFPCRVAPGEDVHKRVDEENARPMQRVMEVYSLTGKYTIEEQLAAPRVFNYD